MSIKSRHVAFLDKYYGECRRNGTKAAEAVGYKFGRKAAQRILGDLEVKEEMARRDGRIIKATELTLAGVVTELMRIADADPIDAYDEAGALKPLCEWPEDLRRALSGIKSKELFDRDEDGKKVQIGELKEVKFWSKTAAADQLMRHLGGFLRDNEQKMTLAELLDDADELRRKDK